MKRNTAFTLAETLIVLMIIGVVAAISIPAIKKDADSREMATKLKKTFTIMAQATDLIIQEEGFVRRWAGTSPQNYYKDKLSVVQSCPPEKGCMYDGNIKMKNGSNDIVYGDRGLLLADGSSVSISPGYGSIDSYGIDPEDYPNVKATMHIDINGAQKPNQWGVDRYLFLLIDGKGLVPSGAFSEEKCAKTYGCVSYVLRTGKIQD